MFSLVVFIVFTIQHLAIYYSYYYTAISYYYISKFQIYNYYFAIYYFCYFLLLFITFHVTRTYKTSV